MEDRALFVMTPGIIMMPELFAGCWAFQETLIDCTNVSLIKWLSQTRHFFFIPYAGQGFNNSVQTQMTEKQS